MIDFSNIYVCVIRKGDLYKYEPLGDGYSDLMPFEELPVEIQERVAMLLTAPEGTRIKDVGLREHTNNFLLRNYQ